MSDISGEAGAAPQAPPGVVHLRGGGVSLLLDARGDGLPEIRHWGEDLGAVQEWTPDLWAPGVANSAVDAPVPLALLPEHAVGWRGRAGLTGHRSGRDWSPSFRLTQLHRDGDLLRVEAVDDVARLALTSDLALDDTGVLRVRHRIRNAGDAPYQLEQLAVVLPVPAEATEVLDLTGRWCRERHPQRRPLAQGSWVREARHGRTGHDATLVLAAGSDGFGFRTGAVWGVHLGWSGDHTSWAERGADGRAVLGAAELLGPGEIVLEPGADYATPWVYATWSGAGLDGLSASYHRWVRARDVHPRRPRPVVLNTWEAVYFDHELTGLVQLADVAAELGVERFVLDDGWFRHRRDDGAGLGDWYVDEDVWPGGLNPLIEHVRRRGMEFGLWVEPEMVNPDSDLFRAHPDWILAERPGGRMPPPWRNEQVLDLARDEAWDYVLSRLDALLAEHEIAYLKWDHNRDLIDAGHDGRPGVHRQTLAVYRLLDELRRRHPGVEIESCASGGARVDLGILERTDRVWASDCNDALERATIQRWTQLLLPPELVGAHIGPPTAHTTGRTHSLSFRAVTALFGSLGIEWDVRSASAAERVALAATIAFYQAHRALLHGGVVVRADSPDPSSSLHGVVAPDGSEAIFAYTRLATSASEVPAPVCLPGLDDARTYRVELVDVAGRAGTEGTPPGWTSAAGPSTCTVSGRLLRVVGLSLPALQPEQAQVLHLTGT